MAKGKECPMCNHYIYSLEEKSQPMGSWVVYEYRSRGFRERVFEPK